MSTDYPIHLAVALDGAGWHPAAWRRPHTDPAELFRPRYWTQTVQEAERGLLDFVTLEDRFAATRPGEAGQGVVHGNLDAALIAARVAPVTDRIGLVPTAIAPHTEPFHISKSVATLDYTSTGRAGLRLRTSNDAREFANIGRRPAPAPDAVDAFDDAFGELTDYVEVVRRLWDSWEDDAEIRDVDTGRFIDRDRLHYINFESGRFSVRGPSITPRPPQGQPPVVALAHDARGYTFGAQSADVVLTTPQDADQAKRIATEIRHAAVAAGRADTDVRVLADLTVLLESTVGLAVERRARLTELAGSDFADDAHVFAGTVEDLADELLEWSAAGLDGFRLRPAATRRDLGQITRELVPILQRRMAFRPRYTTATLRDHLGLPRPVNRYAAA